MRRVLITGVSGYFGSKIAARLEREGDVETVLGVDVRRPPAHGAKLIFERRDVREPLAELMGDHRVDTVIHAAWILPPLHDSGLMESVNREGSRNVFRAAAAAGVERILHCSSTTAYGFHPDNPPFLTEEHPLRGNETFTYAKNKREVEAECLAFRREHPAIGFTTVRPCFVCGPGFDNPLSRYLTKKVVPMPMQTAPFQYVHEDDLVEAMMLLLVQGRDGAYNIAPGGTIAFPEMVRMLGNVRLSLPMPVLAALIAGAWNLRMSRITEFPPAALDMIRYRWLAVNDKLVGDTGYRFRYDAREAFADFARSRKG